MDAAVDPATAVTPAPPRRVAVAVLERQVLAIFAAWGMPAEQAESTARILLAADRRGIDSHGIAMLPLYDEQRRAGKLNPAPAVRVVRESPVTALIDADRGLGHYPSERAMRLAVDKCAAAGLGAVAVRNSNHYGAAGVYALMAAERGFIGLTTTGVWRASVVPTHGRQPMFGTNPIAFAAPAGRNRPFCLDMATSTVAIGKLKLAAFAGRPLPEGWAIDAEGRPVHDPDEALALRHMTPLGGTPEMGSHKGYGLAAMVEVLSTLLPGAWFAPTRDGRHPDADRYNVGHFFLALDPAAFRDDDGFAADLDDMIDALHASPPADPGRPVLVHGDPEWAAEAERAAGGIPVPEKLDGLLRAIAEGCGAPYLLDEAPPQGH